MLLEKTVAVYSENP